MDFGSGSSAEGQYTGTAVAARDDMPASFAPPVNERIADATAFDLSDVDEVDIVAPLLDEPRRTSSCDRADRAPDVLATCALLVFQDRRRRARYGARSTALPGL
jgi:hypothetical protein